MSEMWKQWQGRAVDGKFPLQDYLGGSDHSAVFLSVLQRGTGDAQKVAIKLVSASPDADARLAQWRTARDLNHPNLIRILELGRCKLDDTKLLYVVQEYAEENLSEIVPERGLTAEEARGMLPAIAQVLQFLHDKELVHGRIQPSNILAIGDQLKLSSDTVHSLGQSASATPSAYDAPEAVRSPKSDIWQLGVTLVEVMTQRLPLWDRTRSNPPEVPATVPKPLREIAVGCLQTDPAKRWSISKILSELGEASPVDPTRAVERRAAPVPASSEQPKTANKWMYVVALAAVLGLIVFLIARPKAPVAAPAETQVKQAPATEPKPSPATPDASKMEEPTAGAAVVQNTPANADTTGVVRRVIPQVSAGARRTIHGKIRVRIKVRADAAGNVTDARVESGGSSQYFRRLAVEASRNWKFVPDEAGQSGDRAWNLQFFFTRGGTDASAQRATK